MSATRDAISGDDPFARLRDFLRWVRERSLSQQNAQIDDETLEFVTQGIERFLDNKTPWPKRRGNKPKRDRMWTCYWLTSFAGRDTPHLPQHSEEGGAFWIVGKSLNISPKTVESHVRKARVAIETLEGKEEFKRWLSEYRYKGGPVFLYSADHPAAMAERKLRDSSGVGNRYTKADRKRRENAVSEEIDL
jgi:hypothetical protein